MRVKHPEVSKLGRKEKPLPEDCRPKRAKHVVEYEIDGDFVLYNPRKNTVHILNPTGVVIWQLCDGSTTINQLVRDVATLFNTEVSVVGADATPLLQEMMESDLLQRSA